MADVKSDEVKQSFDNLEKYRLFMEGKLKPFIHKEFDQCSSLLRKITLYKLYAVPVRVCSTREDMHYP